MQVTKNYEVLLGRNKGLWFMVQGARSKMQVQLDGRATTKLLGTYRDKNEAKQQQQRIGGILGILRGKKRRKRIELSSDKVF